MSLYGTEWRERGNGLCVRYSQGVLYPEGVGHEAIIIVEGKTVHVVFKYLSSFLRFVEGWGRAEYR
jgi:hypothetical protein